MYTVGKEYAHAEARKSPVLDGKVERDRGGKEIRYPVILSAQEKDIAKRVCTIFKVLISFITIFFLFFLFLFNVFIDSSRNGLWCQYQIHILASQYDVVLFFFQFE